MRFEEVARDRDESIASMAAYFGEDYFLDAGPAARIGLDRRALEELRGRRARPAEFYLKVAQVYAAAMASGSVSPVGDVARGLDTTPAKARDHVRAARRQGFLTRAPAKGISGGELTDRAKELLREIRRTSNRESP